MTAFITIFTTLIWPLLKGFFGMIVRFATTPGNWVVAGLAVGIAFGVGHHKGKVKERAAWVAQIKKEKEQQTLTITKSDSDAVAKIIILHQELENRNAHINELLAEADMSPTAGRPAIGVNSVRKINKAFTRRPK